MVAGDFIRLWRTPSNDARVGKSVIGTSRRSEAIGSEAEAVQTVYRVLIISSRWIPRSCEAAVGRSLSLCQWFEDGLLDRAHLQYPDGRRRNFAV